MISIKHLDKTYDGGAHALSDINIDIADGDVFGIIGMSGAGKSTLVRTINLLERPTSGTIEVDGRDVTALSGEELRAYRRRVAMIFQNPMTCLNPVYTVGNQLIEALRAHDKKISKADAAKRAMEMLELVGINNVAKRMKQYPHEFSGGMRQRVMIAMGLICHPKLLDCRRAHHRSGRDHSGPDSGAHEGAPEEDSHGHYLHHPQPGRGS